VAAILIVTRYSVIFHHYKTFDNNHHFI